MKLEKGLPGPYDIDSPDIFAPWEISPRIEMFLPYDDRI